MNHQWPQWTEELTTDIVTGEDQLGVEGAAQSHQQYLVPGIITQTNHARYYSFYAWALYRFITGSSRLLNDFKGPYFKRHEVALISSSYSHHKDSEALGGLVGGGNNNSNAKAIWESGDPISLDAKYFENKLGGFGQYYRTAMQTMGLVDEPEYPSWVYRITPRGKELAEAYEQSIKNTAYFKALGKAGSLDHLSYSQAIEYGKVGCICPSALSQGKDKELLREAFFRFDQKGDSKNSHVRRRRTLGVALDLVQGAKGQFDRSMLRPALYLGDYQPGLSYTPSKELFKWSERWKMVEIRHHYSFGLQCLFSAFLQHLSQQGTGISLPEFIDWAGDQLPSGVNGKSASDYLDRLCVGVGLGGSWSVDYKAFDLACRQSTKVDEHSLYLKAVQGRRNPQVLLETGLQILGQLYLRFLGRHESNDPLWLEMATKERLPVTGYFNQLAQQLKNPSWTVKNWLEWLYREYILGQHEFISLEKLRLQRYDTFKFHYRDGQFYWPFVGPDAYREPIRLAGLRLSMALSILTDLGLVLQNPEGKLTLSSDGDSYLKRILLIDNYDD